MEEKKNRVRKIIYRDSIILLAGILYAVFVRLTSTLHIPDTDRMAVPRLWDNQSMPVFIKRRDTDILFL